MMEPSAAVQGLALQLLYSIDICDLWSLPETELSQEFGRFWCLLEQTPEDFAAEIPGPVREAVEAMVRKVVVGREALDASIAQTSRRWRIERMAIVDRSLLRLILAQGPFQKNLLKSAISKAVDLAKQFSTAESAPFVHALLDENLQATS